MNDSAEKRSVSAPKELFVAADGRMKDRMITNFSEYVRALIREDLAGKLQTKSAAVSEERRAA